MLAQLGSDLRFALRQLARLPGFTLTAITTLAIGIGASAAMFSVVNGVLLRPLPYPDPDELAMVWERNLGRGWPRFTVSPANYFDWMARADAFQAMAAYTPGTATLVGEGEPTRLQVTLAWHTLFRVLERGPILGRGFVSDENVPGNDGVAVLSHRLWASRFGADSSLLGRSVVLDGVAVRVIGVLPPDFPFQPQADLFRPLTFPFDVAGARGAHYLSVIARVRDGGSIERADEQMTAVALALEQEYPGAQAGWSATVVPLKDQIVGRSRRPLLVLLGGVALVLLIACANVANLLLARGAARLPEFAVRSALGAGARRLARQLLVESAVLAGLGAAAGLMLALALTRLLVALNPGNLPRVENVGINGPVLLFALAMSVAVGVLVGLLPAVQLSRADPGRWLTQAGTRGQAGGGRRWRTGLLVTEVALAVVLVTGFGLVAKSLRTMLDVETGFEPTQVITARVTLPSARYPAPADRMAFYEAVLERLRALPGVRGAGMTNRLPFTGSLRFGFNVAGDLRPRAEWPSGELRAVNPEYFASLGIPLLRGRGFEHTDDERAPAVAVVSESLARQIFPDRDPIGERLVVGTDDARCPCTIVGVVGDVRDAGIAEPAPFIYYLPQRQSVWTSRAIAVRAEGSPELAVQAIRAAVRDVDPQLALYDIQPMDDLVSRQVATPRFHTVVLGLFGGIALVLAVVGLYGVMSYAVGRRTRELGVRAALGATATRNLWLVQREALAITLTGVVIGLVIAVGTTRFLSGMLFGVAPVDVPTFAAVSFTLLAVGALAAYLPARRASRIAPAEVLRGE